MENISFIVSYSFQWKSFPVVDAIPFRESFCFSMKSLAVVETFSFSRYHSFQRKLLLLIETFPFSDSHSFQCFDIFVSRSYLQLRVIKYIVLDCDSVRLLSMANLSCIQIPIELFQSSEVYLEPCQTSGMKRFCENC